MARDSSMKGELKYIAGPSSVSRTNKACWIYCHAIVLPVAQMPRNNPYDKKKDPPPPPRGRARGSTAPRGSSTNNLVTTDLELDWDNQEIFSESSEEESHVGNVVSTEDNVSLDSQNYISEGEGGLPI